MAASQSMKEDERMSIQKILLLLGLSMLFTACSTGRYEGFGMQGSQLPNTSTGNGVRYLLGRGAPQNDEKAFQYFKQGAEEGDPFAQNEVAYLYAAGKGTTRDQVKAFFWYQKAADQGLASAEYNLGLMYRHGLGTAPNETLAIEWIKKAAARGFEPAKEALARATRA